MAFPSRPGSMSSTTTATPATEARSELGVCILHVPDCPLLGRVRTDVERALEIVGAGVVVQEFVGPYPSPTVLVEGVEVTGRPLARGPSCRLDLPTTDEIVAAILAATAKGAGPENAPEGAT